MIAWLKCAAKNREPVCLRTQCILSTTSPSTSTSTAVLDLEKLRLPSLDAHSDSVAAHKPWTYVGAIGSPKEVNFVLFRILL